ncbi:MAG TPA: GntR family transcriptional regulator [Conexibacter sp.]|nr:GntR family transcriptional regulator [Conexibacter sp.]
MSFTGIGVPNHGGSQSMRVADQLLDRIRAGQHAVGDRLPSERALAEEFGVSRPVIREALRVLVMLQVVDVQVGRGAFVLAEPDLAPTLQAGDPLDLLDVVDVREIMETGALKLASARANAAAKRAVARALRELERAVEGERDTADLDRKLHAAIVDASGSPALVRVWRGLEREISLSIRLSPKGRFMSPEILDEHRRVAAGVTDGALDEALAAAARLHAENRRFVEELARRERGAGRRRARA